MSVPPRTITPPPMYHDAPVNSGLRPYLTLPYLLSLTWLAYPILSLLFIVFRLQISSSTAQAAVDDARDNLMVSCQAAQQAATSAASFPRYMAIATNKQFADAVNATTNGTREALILVLTCMEAIINFLIDIYRSTFLCFLELAIRGGLSILISAVQTIENFIQSSLGSIRTNIQNDVSSFNSLVQSTVDGINKIIPFGKSISAPQLSVPDLDSLQNVTLPTTIQDALAKLNNSIPSLDSIRNSIQGLVDTPFELVKKDINDTFANITFDASVMPVPEQNTLSFCNGLDTSIVDDLGSDLLKIARIGTGIILIIIVLLLLWHCFVEWWKWRSLRSHLENTRLAWISDPTVHNRAAQNGVPPSVEMSDHNLLTLGTTLQHPLLTRLSNWISSVFNLTPTQYNNLQFFFHYVFHPPALACFLIGFFGILSVQIQLLAILPLETKFNGRAASTVTDFSNTIATSVNNSMYNQSSAYANAINANITTFQNNVNDGLFGWVNSTTTTLNNTLVNFYSDVQNVVTQIFGGTPLEQPAQDFIQCIIGSKIDAFEDALTFLHNNLHINLPTMNESALVLSPDDVNQISQPISAAAVGGGSGQDQGGLVGKLIDRYIESLKLERIMFGIFLGLWVIVVIMALFIIFWHSYIKPLRDRRTKRKFEKETELATSSFSWPPQSAAPSSRRVSQSLTSFTPTLESDGGFWKSFRNNVSAAPPMEKVRTPVDSKGGFGLFNGATKGPRKLRAIGRKSMGKEILVSDEEARANREREYATANIPPQDESEDGWLAKAKRFTRAGRYPTMPGAETLTPYELPPTRYETSPFTSRSGSPASNRLKLTISTTAAASSRDNLPIIDQNVEQDHTPVPGSAWSASPNPETPRRLPWLSRNKSSINIPRTQQVPVMQPKIVSRNHNHLPPYKAFQRPAADMPISPPMPLSPIILSSQAYPGGPQMSFQSRLQVPAARPSEHIRMSIPATPHTAMTPVTFLLESTHARRGEAPQVPPLPLPNNTFPTPLNPFATPFDEVAVDPFTPKTPRTPRTPKAY